MWDCGVLFEQTPAGTRTRAFNMHAQQHAGVLLETCRVCFQQIITPTPLNRDSARDVCAARETGSACLIIQVNTFACQAS